MAELMAAALFGLLGGIIRAVVGILKHYRADKKTKLRPYYLISTLIISAAIGLVASVALSTNYIINLVAGYAGIDLLEGLLKIAAKKN